MLITFAWFKDKKKALLVMIIFGAIAISLLLSSLITFVIHNNRVTHWEKVTGVVAANDITDGKTWTEFSYSCNGEEYTTRLNQAYYTVGSEKELLCNPEEPDKIALYFPQSIPAKILVFSAAFFGVFALLYFINYLTIVKKEKKNN